MQRSVISRSMVKETSLPSTFGTPNDVRLFPSTSSAPSGSTRSIPIASAERSVVEMQQDEEEALAEYRDRAMYLRIVHGLKDKQEASATTTSSSQMSLKSCVSDTVAKIARTRNSQLVCDDDSGHYLFKNSHGVCDTRLGYDNVLQHSTDVLCTSSSGEAEDEGIFEMDM